MAELRVSANFISQIAKKLLSDKIEEIEPIDGGYYVIITNIPVINRARIKVFFHSYNKGIINLKVVPCVYRWLGKIIEFVFNNFVPLPDMLKVSGNIVMIDIRKIQLRFGEANLLLEDIKMNGKDYIVTFRIYT